MSAERREDLEGRDRIAELEARYRKTAQTVRIALGVVFVTLVLGFVGFGVLLDRVQSGRRAGLAVSCATTNAIINAGRVTITGGAVGPPRFVRNLERLGFPSQAQRKAGAQKAAAAYAKAITDAVTREAGDEAGKFVRPDGTLRCAALQHIARTA